MKTKSIAQVYGELIDLLRCKDEDFTQQHKNVLLLLGYMMPEEKQVKAMHGVLPKVKEE